MIAQSQNKPFKLPDSIARIDALPGMVSVEPYTFTLDRAHACIHRWQVRLAWLGARVGKQGADRRKPQTINPRQGTHLHPLPAGMPRPPRRSGRRAAR